MPATILGDRVSGKTTFLGLLYSAQVRYGTEAGDAFRFHAPPNTLRALSAVYESINGGDFPPTHLKEQMTGVQFKFLYSGRSPGTLSFVVCDVSSEDVGGYIQTGVSGGVDIISNLLKSNIVVILVDCAKMIFDPDSQQPKLLHDYDSRVSKLMAALQRNRAEQLTAGMDAHIGRQIYPAVVFTKYDTLREEALARIGLPPSPPAVGDRRGRRKYSEALLRAFMPSTLSQIQGGKLGGVSFEETAYFLSWVRTESTGDMAAAGPPRIIRKEIGPGHGAEVDFSYEEYVAFIEHFRRVAKKMPGEAHQ